MNRSCVTPLGAERTAITLAVIPTAKRTEARELHDGDLRVRLQAPALEGRANEALVAWLAKELGLAKRQVSLVRGDTSRRKRVEVDCSSDQVEAWLDRLGVPRA
jgi:uncharacterized protein (TIGR00251 family)